MGTVSQVPQVMTTFSPDPREAGMSGPVTARALPLPGLYSFLFPSNAGGHAGDHTPTIPWSQLSQQSRRLI